MSIHFFYLLERQDNYSFCNRTSTAFIAEQVTDSEQSTFFRCQVFQVFFSQLNLTHHDNALFTVTQHNGHFFLMTEHIKFVTLWHFI